MSDFYNDLNSSLKTGFVDSLHTSKLIYQPHIVVNDWKTKRRVRTTIEEGIIKCDEFRMSVAFATQSGVISIKNSLELFNKSGRKGKILVSQYLNFTEPKALKSLLQLENIELKISVGRNFHSKGYIFKYKNFVDLIVGSSNLTAEALSKNVEWNLKISATNESSIVSNALREFDSEFALAVNVDDAFIDAYEEVYEIQRKLVWKPAEKNLRVEFKPNTMQIEALESLENLRISGKRKSLIISATGTGKTYLAAFDVKKLQSKTLLFVVHRANIVHAAMETFKNVFGDSKSMGVYSGDKKELNKDFIFSTVQTISKQENLNKFDFNYFEYIIIDESHRAGAESYIKLLSHFKSKFLLGMTATPERTDGLDIYKLYDYNIAYEIRLQKALEAEMVCPFHYFGISDIVIDEKKISEKRKFTLLTSEERVKHILERSNYYGCDYGRIRGLVFCSDVDECKELSKSFNNKGYKTVALTGESSESLRQNSIKLLESDDLIHKLDYIFTVDIFNEGIDIPLVNQIILLRPTKSVIVFVQQLGRGLRKAKNKEYLTVLDFIGRYENNYLIPIALFGDTTYNKDSLRKIISSGSSFIPGTSTIDFDPISRKRIFEAIDSANMHLKKDLVLEYKSLKEKIGKPPMMMDFLRLGLRDPYLFVKYSKSYFNFATILENELEEKLNVDQLKLLELFACDILNGKRLEEAVIIKEVLSKGDLDLNLFRNLIFEKYKYKIADKTIESAIRNLNFEFITEKKSKKLLSVSEIYKFKIVKKVGNKIIFENDFKKNLQNTTFAKYLIDNVMFSIQTFENKYGREKFVDGFILYEKYSRKDVLRILNWPRNVVAQNVGGYKVSPDQTNCPIFVTYHKEKDISDTTKYLDRFINPSEFEWMTKSKRNLKSPEVRLMLTSNNLRLPLFVQKSGDEGIEFYFIGNGILKKETIEQTIMPTKGKKVSVVQMKFSLQPPVDETLYNYIIHDSK
jgi:superfamily II DNA or RNA helicase